MPLIHNNPLPLILHLLRAHLQHPHKTSLLLPLRLHSNDLPRFQRVLRVREPAPRRSQARRHQGCAGEHEADGAAVDLDGWQGGREGVDEFQVWDGRAVEGLEEEGC